MKESQQRISIFSWKMKHSQEKDRRRSGDVPVEVLGESFSGVATTDFFSAYNKLTCKKQKCWIHVLRDAKKNAQNNEETRKFCKTVKRLVRDMKKFKENSPQQKIVEAQKRFQRRLSKIITGPYTDPSCIRLQVIAYSRWQHLPLLALVSSLIQLVNFWRRII